MRTAPDRSPATGATGRSRTPAGSSPTSAAAAVGATAVGLGAPARIGVPLRLAAALTGLDGVALAAFGVVQLVLAVIRPRGTALVVAVIGGVLFAAFGVGLVLAARSLWHGRRRGRAPAVVAHLVALLLVPSLLAGGTWWLGLPLAVIAVTALVCVFLPSSVRTLRPAARTPRAPRARDR